MFNLVCVLSRSLCIERTEKKIMESRRKSIQFSVRRQFMLQYAPTYWLKCITQLLCVFVLSILFFHCTKVVLIIRISHVPSYVHLLFSFLWICILFFIIIFEKRVFEFYSISYACVCVCDMHGGAMVKSFGKLAFHFFILSSFAWLLCFCWDFVEKSSMTHFVLMAQVN